MLTITKLSFPEEVDTSTTCHHLLINSSNTPDMDTTCRWVKEVTSLALLTLEATETNLLPTISRCTNSNSYSSNTSSSSTTSDLSSPNTTNNIVRTNPSVEEETMASLPSLWEEVNLCRITKATAFIN